MTGRGLILDPDQPDDRDSEARRYWEGYRDGYSDGIAERRSRYVEEAEPPAGPDYPIGGLPRFGP